MTVQCRCEASVGRLLSETNMFVANTIVYKIISIYISPIRNIDVQHTLVTLGLLRHSFLVRGSRTRWPSYFSVLRKFTYSRMGLHVPKGFSIARSQERVLDVPKLILGSRISKPLIIVNPMSIFKWILHSFVSTWYSCINFMTHRNHRISKCMLVNYYWKHDWRARNSYNFRDV